jgi:hypothetical protein
MYGLGYSHHFGSIFLVSSLGKPLVRKYIALCHRVSSPLNSYSNTRYLMDMEKINDVSFDECDNLLMFIIVER